MPAATALNAKPLPPLHGVSTNRAAVLSYYKHIDAEETEKALDIFAPQARYERQRWLDHGWFTMPNLFAIRDFFFNKRKVRGIHHLQEIIEQSKDLPETLRHMVGTAPFVYTRGIFKGTLDAQAITLPFKDLWIFNNQAEERRPKAVFRKSWISPHFA